MDSKQQTAVEWLFKQLWDMPKDKLDWYAILAQAKQMEKEQIIEAYLSYHHYKEVAKQHYNELYESNRDNQTL